MIRIATLTALLSLPAPALAGSVFLNGVNIDGVRNQEFKNCSVKIDAQGNVHIAAKGYAVKGGGGGTAADIPTTTGGKPTKRYWLVTEKAAPGMTQYDIDLFVNGKWVRKLLDAEEHIVMEITKYLVTGPNKIHFVAKKNIGATGRRSSSPNHYFRVIIGEGDAGGRNVMITKKHVDYKRTAMETKSFNNVLKFNAL